MSAAGDLLAALTPVADALDRLGVAYQVGGSVASSVHGMARATMDIDLVAELGHEHIDDLVGDLTPAYYADADMVRAAVEQRSSCNFIHQATMVKIDLFVSRGRPFDQQALDRRVQESLSDAPGARRSPLRRRRTCCWRSSSGTTLGISGPNASGTTFSASCVCREMR